MLLSFAVMRTGEARALRIEQRQQVDLAAVVQRLRAAQRRFGGRGRGLQGFGALPFIPECDQRVLHILERAHDAVLVAEQRLGLTALGDFVDGPRAARS